MDKERFLNTIRTLYTENQTTTNIGQLSERALHEVMKFYYEPNREFHEVRLNGFVADVFHRGQVVEIQTASFDKIRRKLSVFLKTYPVTLVHPIPHKKWVSWVNPDTHEVSKPKLSGRPKSIYAAIPELYKIRSFLADTNLTIILPLVELKEIRFRDGVGLHKTIRSTKIETYPVALEDEIVLKTPNDYFVFIPEGLPPFFTSKDFSTIAKIPVGIAQVLLLLLFQLGLVERIDKIGNQYLYLVKPLQQ